MPAPIPTSRKSSVPKSVLAPTAPAMAETRASRIAKLPNAVTAPARMASSDSLPIPASRASLARSLLDSPVMVSAMRILSVP